jgi:ectoine hydroxylase-related dioxygenase (phytanoyl-CoA dioxygenase family)
VHKVGSQAGFSIHASILSPRALNDVTDALGSADLVRTRAGARHVLGLPVVRLIAGEPALLAIAREYLGPTPVPFRATLFDKSPAANWLVTWHQDTALPVRQRRDIPGWGPWTTKAGVLHAMAPAVALNRVVALRVHLDDSTRTNGPLRVLPGSHTRGVLTHSDIEHLAATRRPVDCVVEAGGVVAMRPLTVHSSSKAQDGRPRRVLHIEYADAIDLEPGIALAVG